MGDKIRISWEKRLKQKRQVEGKIPELCLICGKNNFQEKSKYRLYRYKVYRQLTKLVKSRSSVGERTSKASQNYLKKTT